MTINVAIQIGGCDNVSKIWCRSWEKRGNKNGAMIAVVFTLRYLSLQEVRGQQEEGCVRSGGLCLRPKPRRHRLELYGDENDQVSVNAGSMYGIS